MPSRPGAEEKEGNSPPSVLAVAAFASFRALLGASEGCQGPCSSEPRERSGLQAHFPAEMTEARDEGSAWGGNESRAGDIGLLVAQQSGQVGLGTSAGLVLVK